MGDIVACRGFRNLVWKGGCRRHLPALAGQARMYFYCAKWLALNSISQLVYTRGSPIPVSLLLTSTNTRALDLLAAPTAPDVKLVCNSFTMAPKNRYTVTDTDARGIQRAVWWPAGTSGESRRLMGEIHLSTALKPGAQLPSWKLAVRRPISLSVSDSSHIPQYAVVIYAPQVAGFVPTMAAKRSERDAPLQVTEIGVASMHARGMPRPVPVSPVVHDAFNPWRREGQLDGAWAALEGSMDHMMVYIPGVIPEN